MKEVPEIDGFVEDEEDNKVSLKRLKKISTKTMTLDLNDTVFDSIPYPSFDIEFSLIGRTSSKIQ
jgi:hypothetical protein